MIYKLPSKKNFPLNKMTNEKRILTLDTINPNLIEVSDAVRGPTLIRAAQLEQQLKEVIHRFFLKKNEKKSIFCPKNSNEYPFDDIIRANIGDPFASRSQKPITYIRQVCFSPMKLFFFLNDLFSLSADVFTLKSSTNPIFHRI